MNVPRETHIFNRYPDRRHVRPLKLGAEMMAAVEAGTKTCHRFVVAPINSVVKPGNFAGLDLDSGRRRECAGHTIELPQVELRARCRFESGDIRAVSVSPAYKPGDLFWIPPKSGGLRASRWTFEVVAVELARVQDMSDASALAEGIDGAGFGVSPRERYRTRWDRGRPRAHCWRFNPWVWIPMFRAHAGCILDVFRGQV